MTLSLPPRPNLHPFLTAASPASARWGAGEMLDALTFRSGAVLASLHQVAAGLRTEATGVLLHKSGALQAAEA